MKAKLEKLEKNIGYRFKDDKLFAQALTHSSYAYEVKKKDISDNEVLEFLGDSVLGFILVDFLCSTFPELSEGGLSKLKSAAASTKALSDFARKIKLEKSIFLGKGEIKSGGQKKERILAGTFEALVAAIYLDGGIEAARNFLCTHLDSLFKKVDVGKFTINNYKSALQEHLQKTNFPAPLYKTITTKGPDHKKRFVVEVFSQNNKLAKATGSSKKEAEQKAAQKAIKSFLGKKLKPLTANTILIKKKHD